MKILIRGTGLNNKGDEAMILTVQRELSRRLHGVRFAVSFPAEHVNQAFGLGLDAEYFGTSRFAKLGQLTAAWIRKAHVRQALHTSAKAALEIDRLGAVSAVLDVSGFNYSDEWGPHCADLGLAWSRYCRATGRPYICMPQAWGPFTDRRVARAVGELVRNSALVWARDHTSHKYLCEAIPASKGRVVVAPDIAFAFKGASPADGAAVLHRLGLVVGESPIVGITPNPRVYERTEGTGVTNSYVQMLLGLIRYCTKSLGAKVVLIPNELAFGNIPKRDDRYLCGLMKAHLSDLPDCVAIEDVFLAKTSQSIIANLDMLIGSRFHSLVFALGATVPAVALGWSHKYRELMQLAGLEDLAFSHTALREDAVVQIVDRVWHERHAIKTKLQVRTKSIERDVGVVFDTVAALIDHKTKFARPTCSPPSQRNAL